MRQEAVRPGEVTELLQAARAGQQDALDRLLPLVYEQLRVMAQRQLRRERAGHTLQATALVHEAFMKLAAGSLDAADRAHFLAIAARTMRQVLIDLARNRKAVKRGGGWERLTLIDGDRPVDFPIDEWLALDEALEQLDPRQRQVVELRFFAGLDEREIATLLEVNDRTVRRDWVKARAWLYRSLYGDTTPPSDASSAEISS